MNISDATRQEREFNEANPDIYDELADEQYQEEALAGINRGIHSDHEHGKEWSRFNALRDADRAEDIEKQVDHELDKQAAEAWETHVNEEGSGSAWDRDPTDGEQAAALEEYKANSQLNEQYDIHADGDKFAAVLNIPAVIQKDYGIEDLKDCGVKFTDDGKYVMHLNIDLDGSTSLVRQLEEPGFPRRFETAMHDHYAPLIKEEARLVALQTKQAEDNISLTLDRETGKYAVDYKEGTSLHQDGGRDHEQPSVRYADSVNEALSLAFAMMSERHSHLRSLEAPVISADYHSPGHDSDHGAIDIYKVNVGYERIGVDVTFNDAYKVADIRLNEHESDYDYERDGAAGYDRLNAIVENNKAALISTIQEKSDSSFDSFLHQFGWAGDENLKSGFCVISSDEIARLKAEAAAKGQQLTVCEGVTTEGRPTTLTFDVNGKMQAASPVGISLPLNPIIENSRAHFVEVKAQLSEDDITVTKNREGDYRVDYRAGTRGHVRGDEGSSSPFCEDMAEVVNTAKAMIAVREREAANDTNRVAASATRHDDDEDRLVARM